MQAIGQAFGGNVVRAPLPVHGKLSKITHEGFTACSAASTARSRRRAITRWWSSAPRCRPNCRSPRETADGLVMGIAHKTLPLHGVQFHPESIASEHGHLMLTQFSRPRRRLERQAWPTSRRASAHVARASGEVSTHGPISRSLIAKVATGAALTREEAASAFDRMMSGEATPSQMGGLLMALRVRGETVDEITGAVTTMRAKMLRRRRRRADAIDVVGTGGDASGSLQHFDLRGFHRRRRRRAGRQARQPRAVVEVRRGRCAGRARRQDRSARRTRSGAASRKPASASCSRRRIIRR